MKKAEYRKEDECWKRSKSTRKDVGDGRAFQLGKLAKR